MLKYHLPVMVLACSGLTSVAMGDPLSYSGYTYDATGTTPSGTYPDTGGTQLNNNAVGTTSFSNAEWVGFGTNPGQIRININFGSNYDFSNLTVDYLSDTVNGIFAPASVDVSFDGGAPVNFTGFNGATGNQVRSSSFNLSGHSGESVQLRFNPISNPPHPGPWVFLGELDFDGTAVVPEPTSAALILCGGALLLTRRGRR